MHKSIFLAGILVLAISCTNKTTVDLVVKNGIVYTVDSSFTIAEAFAVKDGKIIATGTNQSITASYTTQTTIDVQGKPVYPGFIDAHAHFVGYAIDLQTVDLVGTESWEAIIHAVTDAGKSMDSADWLIGRGWDQNDWPVKEFPSNEKLNKRFPNRPVLLTRIDGHAAIANQKALD